MMVYAAYRSASDLEPVMVMVCEDHIVAQRIARKNTFPDHTFHIELLGPGTYLQKKRRAWRIA